ncbi:Putative protein of unknown function [Podospora comata]|uniref:F-box domain-containing protein n=1 Tax=Podospora comata TaxID=48703 RepID=A0ABY6S353_PODCO|nr:Putative protein of unknown function [Podospora comata]
MSFRFIASHRQGGTNNTPGGRNMPSSSSGAGARITGGNNVGSSSSSSFRNNPPGHSAAAPNLQSIEFARWIFEQQRTVEMGVRNEQSLSSSSSPPVIVISDDEEGGGGGGGGGRRSSRSIRSVRRSGMAVKRRIDLVDGADGDTIVARPPGVGVNRGSEIIDLTSPSPPPPPRAPKRQRTTTTRYQDRNEPEEEMGDDLRWEIHALLGERYSHPRRPQPRPQPRPSAPVVEPSPSPPPSPELQKPKHLQTLPLEILTKIYRHLLVSPKPIPVKDLFQEVIRAPPRRTRTRNPPTPRRAVLAMGEEPEREFSIEIGILLVNKQSFAQGIQILYGENTFSYLLRDPSAARTGGAARSRRDGQRNRIHWSRYGGLVRQVEIEMERNRTGGEYANLLRRALEKLRGVRLRELVLRLSPLYEKEGEGRHLSVVSLFGRNAPVMRALRGVEVDFLRVGVNVNSHLIDGEEEDETEGEEEEGEEEDAVRPRRWALEMGIDLRWVGREMERLRREGVVGEGWENDEIIKQARVERGRRAEENLGRLRRLIEEACEMPEYVVKLGMRGGLWKTVEEAERLRQEERKRMEKKFDVDGYDDLDPTRKDVVELRKKIREEEEEEKEEEKEEEEEEEEEDSNDEEYSDEESDEEEDSDEEDDDDDNTDSDEESDSDDDSYDDDDEGVEEEEEEEDWVEIKDIPLSRRLKSLVISIDKVGGGWKCFRI